MSSGIAHTLASALAVLRVDAPAAYFRLAGELEGLAVHLEVDEETFGCQCADSLVAVAPPAPNAQTRLRTDRRTILALIDGRCSYLEAVLARNLAIQGRPELLARISRAAVAFSEGALRSRRMRGLLDEFRADTTRTEVQKGPRQSWRSIM